MWLPLGSRMKGSVGDAFSGAYNMRMISLIDNDVFSSVIGLWITISRCSLGPREQPQCTRALRRLPSHVSRDDQTYISWFGVPVYVNGMREGLCQAINPKMKIKTHPALTESVNRGLRPPTDGIMTMSSGTARSKSRTKERRNEKTRKDCWR